MIINIWLNLISTRFTFEFYSKHNNFNFFGTSAFDFYLFFCDIGFFHAYSHLLKDIRKISNNNAVNHFVQYSFCSSWYVILRLCLSFDNVHHDIILHDCSFGDILCIIVFLGSTKMMKTNWNVQYKVSTCQPLYICCFFHQQMFRQNMETLTHTKDKLLKKEQKQQNN